jgi:hypothetical protein
MSISRRDYVRAAVVLPMLAAVWAATALQRPAVAQTSRPASPLVEPRKKAAESRAIFDKAAAAKPIHMMLRVQPAARMEASWSEDIEVPSYQVDHWVLFAAKPINLPGQREVSASMNPAPAEIVELGPLKRKLFVARISPSTKLQRTTVSVRVQYKADLLSRQLVPIAKPPPVAPLGRLEHDQALLRSQKLDFDSPTFQQWLDTAKLRPANNESELDYAARVFKWIRGNCSYQYKRNMDRQASHVCVSLKSDCDGLSTLFCCVLRANDIPARTLVGRWVKSSRPGQHVDHMEYFQEHVKAEFFAQGVGWVPVDVSRHIAFDHSLTPPFWGSFLDGFGQDEADFFVLHLDGPLIVEPLNAGVQEVQLQNIAYWVSGKGKFDDKVTNQKWEVRLERIDTPASRPATATTRPAGHALSEQITPPWPRSFAYPPLNAPATLVLARDFVGHVASTSLSRNSTTTAFKLLPEARARMSSRRCKSAFARTTKFPERGFSGCSPRLRQKAR